MRRDLQRRVQKLQAGFGDGEFQRGLKNLAARLHVDPERLARAIRGREAELKTGTFFMTGTGGSIPLADVKISNLRYGSHGRQGIDPSSFGTLGFLATPNRGRDREVVMVSNRHILLAQGAHRGDAIYRTSLSTRNGTVIVQGADAEPFAEILDEGAEENHTFRYPGESAAPCFVDCATARILSHCLSPTGSLSPTLRGIGRINQLDVIGGRVVHVWKAGSTIAGRVTDAAAVVQAGGIRRTGNLAIQSKGSLFAGPGDSGALIVNDRGQAVGLLWGRNEQNPDIAYACHIHPVLDRLQVTMLAGALK